MSRKIHRKDTRGLRTVVFRLGGWRNVVYFQCVVGEGDKQLDVALASRVLFTKGERTNFPASTHNQVRLEEIHKLDVLCLRLRVHLNVAALVLLLPLLFLLLFLLLSTLASTRLFLLDLFLGAYPEHFHGLVVRLDGKVGLIGVESDLGDAMRRRKRQRCHGVDEFRDLDCKKLGKEVQGREEYTYLSRFRFP